MLPQFSGLEAVKKSLACCALVVSKDIFALACLRHVPVHIVVTLKHGSQSPVKKGKLLFGSLNERLFIKKTGAGENLRHDHQSQNYFNVLTHLYYARKQ